VARDRPKSTPHLSPHDILRKKNLKKSTEIDDKKTYTKKMSLIKTGFEEGRLDWGLDLQIPILSCFFIKIDNF
jgi:hypothetical protein